MEECKINHNALYRLLEIKCERETLEYVLQGMKKVLGVSASSGYELMHEPDFPMLRIGNRMVVPKEQFIQWVVEHTEGGERN